MKTLSHLRLAAALLALATTGLTSCTKEDGFEPSQSAGIRDLRADAGTAEDRRRNDLPFDARDTKSIHDQGALDFTPALHGELDADDVVMIQIDKSALAGKAAYKLMVSKKGIVRFLGLHDTAVPLAELRLSGSQLQQLEQIAKDHAISTAIGSEKDQEVAVCYFFSKAGNQSGKQALATSGRDFQNIEAEVLGAIGLDKLLLGNTFATLHD